VKKKLILLFAIAIAVALPAKAQDEAPGSQQVITAAVPPGGFDCGRALTQSVFCSNIPINVGGTCTIHITTAALDPRVVTPYGTLNCYGVSDIGVANVTGGSVTYNSLKQVTSATFTLTGTTNDGDNDSFKITLTVAMTYTKQSGGSGRGGGYPGYNGWLQSATLTITYN
jgi:hypothetical protein